MSAFRRWFVGQHGPRPSRLTIDALRKRLNNAEQRAWMAKLLLKLCERYDERETSALWAWQARERGRAS